LEPQLHSSTKKVAARSSIIKHLKLQLTKEKEKCKRDGENNDIPNLRIKEKEGFVFKQNSIKEWLLRYLIIRDESLFTVKKEKKSNRYSFNDATFF
jgi:retron-type reverse transcriptase